MSNTGFLVHLAMGLWLTPSLSAQVFLSESGCFPMGRCACERQSRVGVKDRGAVDELRMSFIIIDSLLTRWKTGPGRLLPRQRVKASCGDDRAQLGMRQEAMADGIQQTSVSFASSAHRRRSLRDLGHIARRWGTVTRSLRSEMPKRRTTMTRRLPKACCRPWSCLAGSSSARMILSQAAITGVPRSLTVILELDGGATRYRLGSTGCSLGPGRAAVVAAADRSELTGCYRRGDRSRSH